MIKYYLRKYSFTERIVDLWNCLPTCVVESPPVDNFKRNYRHVLTFIIIQLFNSKCLPVLLYGLEACSLSKSDLSSIDFAFKR